MYNIDEAYKLRFNPLDLEVTELVDFQDMPILNIEKDSNNNFYISYLAAFDEEKERRIIAQVSLSRLSAILSSEIDLHYAFSNPENNQLYICDFSLQLGTPISTYLLPVAYFVQNNPIKPYSYIKSSFLTLDMDYIKNEQILQQAIGKSKLILDLYVNAKNISNSIKPYVFFKIFNPIIEIINDFLDIDKRSIDKYISFSNVRQGSFGISIEINYSQNLFQTGEEVSDTQNVMQLFKAITKQDFTDIISQTKDEKYIKPYSTIIKAIIDNNVTFNSVLANPVENVISEVRIDPEKAKEIKKILDESFDVIEDVEEIEGNFLEIDIDKKLPSFKIYSYEDDFTLKGTIELSLIDKLKSDLINLGKETYAFTIKTVYHPETTVKSEEVKRFLINYEKRE